MHQDAAFDIIRFTPTGPRYYGASIQFQPILLESGEYVKHTELDIPLGLARYGGPVVDLPPGMAPPDGLRFAAQLDLSQVAPHDPSGLLPTSGQLYFFADITTTQGIVFYADVPNEQLVRTVQEHEDNFFEGRLIGRFFAETETLAERYGPGEEDDEDDWPGWNDFAGSKKSKLFGIYTHCQLSEEEIKAITFSDQILLLQVGEDFNDEGVFSVLIDRDALRRRDFTNCQFAWGQS
ncbi:DUF1963 domain-containing protein [Hymenobacter sp. DG01]|uniref:DUF1963 domain-containing protein n=1 Tax=Hymenobacter sp. DG01 TaxID=2584940 RepID=UPI0011201644|nr:DUF1963 domain-containing protein [Hymenobacter sp. DG01]